MHVINSRIERPSKALIEKARQTWACIAGGEAGRRNVMDPGLRPLKRDWRFAGPAVTVSAENPFDTLLSQVATLMAEPGDVLVIDAGGRTEVAAWGATMTWGAKTHGIAGIIVDGAVLTTELLIDHEGVPVFARGSVAQSIGGGHGPGSINVPIVCGGAIVNPGDLILADEDGIVVLPLREADKLLTAAGQGRAQPYPPAGRSKPYDQRGYIEKLKAIEGIEWR
ncbi:MAG: dimethylmenaquinone methyltransferase [Alphaproteobacteria bacterium]|nr:dimethylmenaquinone methyltransferase [Alphaproteobacteria bacterium]